MRSKKIDLREYKEFSQILEVEEALLIFSEGNEVLETKIKELNSWKENNVYQEVRREGQKLISAR